MRGYSIYFPEIDDEYMQKMNDAGWEMIFTSLHVKEYQADMHALKKLFTSQAVQGKKIIVDVSPATLRVLGINDYHELKDFGITHLRLDYGFSIADMLRLQEHFVLIFNASVLDEVMLEEYQASGIQLTNSSVMHNFYPHEYTGLGYDYVLAKNELFHKYGLRVQGFVAGDMQLRGPIFAGLPTVERLRQCSPASSFVVMQELLGFDDIFIGDFQISDEQREAIDRYCATGAITLTCSEFSADYKMFLGKFLTNRQDISEYVIRIRESRAEGVPARKDIEPYNIEPRPMGSITVDNNGYGRYCGEMQIVRCDLPEDMRVNVIGQVSDADLAVLPCIKSATPIYLIYKEL
ncbi:MupG family TIM beta-alpha barrel fold protein [Culicoidibacter larvae]|nr:MupG family TIM beta-alpha barrel fold protein [Culicoidibacter larvae]